ncbi:MAG: cobalamin biosynthesis protein CobD [Campylobacterales bacterium]|nr:cobalamin biosynthesis protein CobD [Campylobacterales bacterium]
MSNLAISFFAYLLDRLFGEFSFVKHPVILIGEAISWFEKHFYADSIFRGVLLTLFILLLSGSASLLAVSLLALLPWYLQMALSSFLASMFLAHRMLYDAVAELIGAKEPREKLKMLVSRDTSGLSESEVYKAGIETYAENLSDAVVAPLFYLLLFGLPGIILYKAVNTLDSMVGYRNERYEKFGKVSARLDDAANLIPSRLTAMMIMLLGRQRALLSFYTQGREHSSPNAGHPITAMAMAVGVRLGGPTFYFGKLQPKAYFGHGREEIEKEDLFKALGMRTGIDLLILLCIFTAWLFLKYLF